MKDNQIKNSVLIIAVHPDNETLGCAGALVKHIAEGDVVNVIL